MKNALFLRKVLFVLLTVFLCACSQENTEQETLVALGDSITYGANLSDREQSAYPYIIGEKAGFEVINKAVSGWQTSQVIEALQEDAEYQESVENADIIVMTIGGNDLLRILRNAEAQSTGDTEIMMGIVMEELRSNIVFDEVGELIEEIRSLTDAEILLYNIYNPLSPSNSLYLIGDSLLPQVNTAIANVAESYEKVYLADAFTAYRGNQDDYIIKDDIHPTKEGQAVLAEIGLQLLSSD